MAVRQSEEIVWIIDDDGEDHDLIREIFKEARLPNKLEFFKGAEAAIEKLKEVKEAPFIMICDVNLPKIDGFELREQMLATANNKFHSVPFIFWSTHASEAQVRRAFQLKAHGFFIKEPQMEQWKATLIQIVEYWRKSRMPSKHDEPDAPQSF